MGLLWGIDLGGTKIEGIVMEPRSNQTFMSVVTPLSFATDTFSDVLKKCPAEPPEVISRIRIPTGAEKGYEHIVESIGHLVQMLEDDAGMKRPTHIGIGTPGASEPATGIMKNSNTTCLNGKPLKGDLERTLGVDLRMTNDANCFALAEATFGVAHGKQTVFGVILGTGVGGGVVVDGKALNGLHGIAGEWGHNTLIPGGLPCYCGKRGCVEKYLSGPAASEEHYKRTGKRLTMKEIAESSDPECQETLCIYCERLGQALAVIVNILDPDAIVLGGGVGNIEALYTEGRKEIAKHVFNPTFHTPLLKPELGDSAGVFGAAMLVA